MNSDRQLADSQADRCAHCGLPVGVIEASEDMSLHGRAFCCSGCRTVYSLIHDNGWEEYYSLRSGEAQPATPEARGYQEYDHPAFRETYARCLEEEEGDAVATDDSAPAGELGELGELEEKTGPSELDSRRWRIQLSLPKVHCAACVWLVERLLKSEGCEGRVDLGRQRVEITWRPAQHSLAAIAGQLDRLGYSPSPWREEADSRRREERLSWVRLAVCGASAGNVMFLAFALYAGLIEETAQLGPLFRWASFLVSLPAVLWGGMVFYRGAWGAVRYRIPHIDLPITIAIGVAMAVSTFNVVRGQGEIYFDTLTTLIFLLLIGRYLQQRQQRRAADASTLLEMLTPRSARRQQGDAFVEVPAVALAAGDCVEVRAGEVVPADGVVISGASVVDKSLLTGESDPHRVTVGQEVFAGFDNLESPLLLRVERVGEATRAGRLVREVEAYAQRRGAIQELANRLAGAFVAIVLLLATICGIWWWVHDPSRVVDSVVALLVVSCPCALGLATPLVVSAAVGQLARRGIWVKGGGVLESLSRPGFLWLDKTGTVTRGQPSLLYWYPASEAYAGVSGGESDGGLDGGTEPDEARECVARDLRQMLNDEEPAQRHALTASAALERNSRHPLAQPFAPFDDPTREVQELQEQRGGGLSGRVAAQSTQLGSVEFLTRFVSANQERSMRACATIVASAGLTPVGIVQEGEWLGTFALGDALRPGSREQIVALQQRGWEIGMLSGDHPLAVERCAEELSLPADRVFGGREPESKAEVVAATETRPVVMVGDGINDTVALAAADVGIAVGGAAELTLRSADVTCSAIGLEGLLRLFTAAKHARHVILRNIVFSLLYNVVGISLAFAGYMDPLGAAILMPISSLTIVMSSYRAHYVRGKEHEPRDSCIVSAGVSSEVASR